jgi:hypothetical protein
MRRTRSTVRTGRRGAASPSRRCPRVSPLRLSVRRWRRLRSFLGRENGLEEKAVVVLLGLRLTVP